jgi:glycosyltransferase involved in cell wall biosynthesis
MKILISIANLKIGGAQVVALRLAKGLSEKGHSVDIYDLFPDERNDKLIENIYPEANILSVSENQWGRTLIWKMNALIKILFSKFSYFNYRTKQKLNQVIETGQYDIIHSHMFHSDFTLAECCPKKDRNKLILTMHGCYEEKVALFGYQKMTDSFTKIFEAFEKIIYLTKKNIDIVKDYIDNQSIERRKIYNGFDINSITKYTEEAINRNNQTTIGMVARGVKEKGWEEAILASVLLQEKYDININVMLIGDSAYLKELQGKYKQYAYINFLGYLDNPLKAMATCNIGILPSYTDSESLPTCIVEFMALGIPIVATDVGEIPFMVSDESQDLKAGVIIKSNQEKINAESLALELSLIIQNASLYEKMQNDAIKLSQVFNIDKCIQSHLKFYAA